VDGSLFLFRRHDAFDDLLLYCQDHLVVENTGAWMAATAGKRRKLAGQHGHAKDEIMPVMVRVYGENAAARWFQRWRIFSWPVQSCGASGEAGWLMSLPSEKP
jgi:hypothetical protein